MKSAKMLTELLQKPQPQLEERQIEVPLVFVEVTPAQAATEAPKETKFYSDKNFGCGKSQTSGRFRCPKNRGQANGYG